MHRIADSIRSNKRLSTPSIKLGHILVLKSLLKCPAGLQWLADNSAWIPAIDYCTENQTVYVVREAQSFANECLFKCINQLHSEELCRQILTYAAAPIKEAVIVYNGIVCIDSADLQRKVSPTISLLCTILGNCIRGCENDGKVAAATVEIFNAEVNLWRLISMTKNQVFFREIMLAHSFVNCAQRTQIVSEFHQRFFDHINYCIANSNATAMIAVANSYHSLWIGSSTTTNKHYVAEDDLNFENEIFVIMLLPIVYLIGEHEKQLQYRHFDRVLKQIYGISIEESRNQCLILHEYFSNNRQILEMTCSNAIQTMLTMQLQAKQTVQVFEMLVQLLDIIGIELLTSLPQFLSTILNALHKMAKDDLSFSRGNNLTKKLLLLLECGGLECRVSV